MGRSTRRRLLTGLFGLALIARSGGSGAADLIEPFVGALPAVNAPESWRQFTSADDHAVYVFGRSGLSSMRPWIGFSDCGSCTPTRKTQAFRFTGLDAGSKYALLIKPAYVSSGAEFEARVTGGDAEILAGARARFRPGRQDAGSRWLVRFRARSSDVTLELGSAESSGKNYLNFGFVVSDLFTSRANLPALAERKYAASYGDGYPTKLTSEAGDYNWAQSYLLDACVSMYELTGDAGWLRRVARRSRTFLEQRDSETVSRDYRGRAAPAWQERKSRYVWIGFTGAMFQPMLRFARLVASDDALRTQSDGAGGEFGQDARDFAEAFDRAMRFHEPDWKSLRAGEGTYTFPADLPVNGAGPLLNQPAPVNMSALFMEAVMEYGLYQRAIGRERESGELLRRVGMYASHLRSSVLTRRPGPDGQYLQWNYSSYYDRADDIGHGNLVVRFLMRAREHGLGFGTEDAIALAATYDRFLGGDGQVLGDLIDGSSEAKVSSMLFCWHLVAPLKDDLLGKDLVALLRKNFTFVDLVNAAYAARQ